MSYQLDRRLDQRATSCARRTAWSRCTAPTSCRCARSACRPAATTQGHRFEAQRRADRAAATPTTTREQLEQQGAVIAGFDAPPRRDRAPAAARRGAAGPDADRRRRAARRGDGAGRAARTCCCAASSREFLAVPPECLILTMKANQKYFPLLDARGHADQPLPRRQQHPARPIRARVIARQRARRAAAPGRRQVLLRPGPQEDARVARAAARQGGLPRQARHAGRARRARARDRARRSPSGSAARRWRAGRPRRAAGQGRPADRHGRRVPRAAGRDGRLLRAPRRRARRRRRARSRTTTSRASPATRCRATRSAIALALADKLETLVGSVRHRPEADRRQGPVRAAPPCAGRDPHAGRARRCRCDAPVAARPAEAAQRRSRRSRSSQRRRARSRTSSTSACVGYLREPDYSAQEVDAVVGQRPPRWPRCRSGWRRCARSPRCPRAAALAAANKRVGNILKKSDGAAPRGVDAGAAAGAGRARAAPSARRRWRRADAGCFDDGDYTASLQALAALKAPVDAFFDERDGQRRRPGAARQPPGAAGAAARRDEPRGRPVEAGRHDHASDARRGAP